VIYARVAVPVPLGQAFTYSVPDELAPKLVRGSRVLCEFGRRQVLGVVLDLGTDAASVPEDKIRPLRAIVDADPVFEPELLDFLLELARYYIAPIGEVMRLALPPVEREAAEALEQKGIARGRALKTSGRLVQFARAIRPRPTDAAAPRGQAAEVLAELELQERVPVTELEQRWSSARAALKKLTALGLVALGRHEPSDVDPFFAKPAPLEPAPELTAAQREAHAAIARALENHERSAFLLQGVTGSGKTEVYLRAVELCLRLGRGAIVLVPEIALTPQLVSRFRARLGDDIAVLHSGLTPKERHRMWRRLRQGELCVAVGARSALFAPVRRLGLLCVDEEHDGSFKQEEGVRYHARDMALLRAHRAAAAIVLGSATPSLESEMLVRQRKLIRLRLPERAHKLAKLPRVEIVNLRQVGPGPSQNRLLTLPLHRALEQVLERREQAILFLNRRGFAPSIVCDSCGKVAECPNCSVALTLHTRRGERLQCHYCDYESAMIERCPTCQSVELGREGVGTERVEAALQQSFPTARIARLDRDVAAGARVEQVLDRMRNGEADVLVGTQMVTKGHDLPRVTLVGVLNADAALSMPDFRAAERTFQLLVQVAGRAGRSEAAGTVIVQTRTPEAHAILYAVRHDVDGFLERELAEREELSYPPYSRLALIKIDAAEDNVAKLEAERLARVARRCASNAVTILGPAAAPLARLRNRYRYRIMLRSRERHALREPMLAIARERIDRHVRVALDMDAVSML
jgi:primosomal protein N' (replication factor Y)